MIRKRMLRSVTVLAAAAACSAGGAGAAPRTAASLHRCGGVAAGGVTWKVSASSVVPCASARSIVKKLGAKPTPPVTVPYYSGVYLGMRCLGAKKNGNRLIDCGGTGGRAVAAVGKS
jgi:hypothetical protein